MLLLLAALAFSSNAFSQVYTNLIFFSEQGERFTVILNGIRQNTTPETNVKVTDLIAPNYKLKVIFDDPNLGELDKNLMFNQGTETTFVITKNKKNEYVLRWMNEVPIHQALPPAPGQQVVVYHSQPAPTGTVTQTTTTYTESYGDPQGNVSMGVNINDPELGVNMNINVGGMLPSGSQVTTSLTTTTYSTTTTSGGYEPTHQQPAQQAYVLPGYNGPIGCAYPMHPGDFQGVKQSIESKSFDDTKLKIAKQVIASNCLLSDQVKEIMLLFTFEDTRLDLAKYAYGYTFDIGNYYRLNDAFTFESSIEELDEYIMGYRR
ncbi:MAG: hypothetical protein FD170_2784 [Bacteroidetes bacterium]|nr:MAG: hypothetical protein FD170_2784 [Bacteroidota bacterium]